MGMEGRYGLNRGPSALVAIVAGIDAILLSLGWGDVDISAYSMSLIVPAAVGLVVMSVASLICGILGERTGVTS